MATTEKEEKKVLTPQEQLKALLSSTKDDHFNFEDTHDYKVRCSSMELTTQLCGGLAPGAHRFIGITAGGKTSCALDFLYHFLKENKKNKYPRRGVYIKAEGRLSQNMMARSGVKFVYSYEEWEPGTCFVFESNIFETVFKFKRELIDVNPTKTEYFFITDSADGLIKKDDAIKAESEAQTVAGGANITSVFLKKVGLKMAKRGHISLYISQYREQPKINTYDTSPPKQGNAAGPRALEHQVDVALQFIHRVNEDLITENGEKWNKNSKIIGHWAKIKILKSDDEKQNVIVKYPIRYGMTNASSVWTAYEVTDWVIKWGFLEKGGAWLNFEDKTVEDMQKTLNRTDIPNKFNGITKAREWFNANPDVMDFWLEKSQMVFN